MERQLFVQFMHPGAEHGPNRGTLRTWNTSEHRRKFLVANGRIEGSGEDKPIVLWGEWEPPSEVTPIRELVRGGPRFLHRPFWMTQDGYRGLQNTDPFVFGGFYYSICKQATSKGMTQLRWLKRGSVLLFGSKVAGSFMLDTVFVVRDYVDHSAADYMDVLYGVVPEEYLTVSLRPYYESLGREDPICADAASLRLYVGATEREPINGMHSFFPCQAHEERTRGFARPKIVLPGVINPASSQAASLNKHVQPAQFHELWHRVREQVLEQGCQVGTFAEFPERKE